MEIRYFSITKESPKVEGRISFCQETPLSNKNVMHCITGVTGSGKTSLLQAMASVVWCLLGIKNNTNKISLPDFQVTLVYDVEVSNNVQTICFRHKPKSTSQSGDEDNSAITEFIAFNRLVENITNWDEVTFNPNDENVEKLFSGSDFLTTENIAVYLPAEMFIYTTGKTVKWKKLFGLEPNQHQLNPLSPLIQEEDMQLAICALALSQEINLESSFGNVLNRLDFLNSLEVSFKLSLSLAQSLDGSEKTALNFLKKIATTSAIDPNNDSEYLAFGFPLIQNQNIKDKLALFNQLRKWQQIGLLKDVNITLNKANADGQIEQLSYDCLSDGEQSLLGQVALFSVLHNTNNALLLLDEPEKLLNDYWKREIVALINESLGQTNNSIVFTCNSALPITDLFHNQLTIMSKVSDRCLLADSFTRTFAASPAEIMYDLFHCKETVGEDGCRFLNSLLPSEADFDISKMAETIEKLEKIEELLGGGYYQLEFRRRLRTLRKLVV